LYLHLQQVGVLVNQSVGQGQQIGLSGKTGYTNCGPHLHFQRQAQGIWITNSTQVYFDEYPGQQLATNSTYVSQNGTGGGGSCGGPPLSSPGDNAVSSNAAVTFSWSSPGSCTFSGYTFRIKTTSNMDSGGTTLVDTGEGNTQR